MTTQEPLPFREVCVHFCLSLCFLMRSLLFDKTSTPSTSARGSIRLRRHQKTILNLEIVRVRLKYKHKGLTKFSFKLSSLYKIPSVKGIVIKLRELASGRGYVKHHNRPSNPLFYGKSSFLETYKPMRIQSRMLKSPSTTEGH